MKEVIDEILNGEPKYRIIDANGNIILDKVSIELITEIIKPGTPLNRFLFGTIKADIGATGIFNKLELGYLKEFIPVSRNIVPTSWDTNTQTSCVKGDVTFSVNGVTSTSYTARNAVDGDDSTFWRRTASNPIAKIDFFEPKMIKSFRIKFASGGLSKAIIQGSNDDSNWEDLKTLTTALGSATVVELDKVGEYRYYRLNITNNNSSLSADLHVFETKEVYEKPQELILNQNITEYVENMLINVCMPLELVEATDSIYMNINNLGPKLIKGTIKPATYYTMLYDGTVFNVFQEHTYKEV